MGNTQATRVLKNCTCARGCMYVNISVTTFPRVTRRDPLKRSQCGPQGEKSHRRVVQRGWEGKVRLITQEENGVGRPQGQAESNWSTLPVAALILVTFLIAATKYRTRSNLKKEGFVLVYTASQLDPQAGGKEWPGHKNPRSSEPLFQARLYLQNIPQLSKIVSLTENQAFIHSSYIVSFCSKSPSHQSPFLPSLGILHLHPLPTVPAAPQYRPPAISRAY